MNTEDRDAFFDELGRAVAAGEMTWGEVVRALRVDVAGVSQVTFAKMTKLSERTLRQLEADKGNPTLATLQAVVEPFGFRVGIQRKRPESDEPV